VLVTHYVLFVIDLATRAVEIAGIATSPEWAFMTQLMRNLIDHVDGFLRGRDSLSSTATASRRSLQAHADRRRRARAADSSPLAEYERAEPCLRRRRRRAQVAVRRRT